MSTIINTNVQALNTARNLKIAGDTTSKASEKLSSGSRINHAGDDAAGLAISEKMRSQIRGLNMASKNAQDGISMIQTAEGALQETHEMLQRARELVVQASNDTNVSSDRAKIATELGQLMKEVDATGSKTEFNTKKLINGGLTEANLQVGANGSSEQRISFAIGAMNVTGLGLDSLKTAVDGSAPNFKSMGGSDIAGYISTLDTAIEKVSTQRADMGSIQNRLEHTIKSLDTSSENLSAAESRIRDTDMAKEMMNFTKSNVLQQAATSMLSQANQAPNNVLSLLR